ncbi:MAG: DPP IV N-terminal domain-containing protein [Gemmatimonadaceae bacterium]
MRSFRTAVALLAGIVITAVGAPVGAQGYFGQNQVQYDRFDWRVLETEHFLIHYYKDERAATIDAARMAERAYARLSRVLDHQFREKKPIVIFSSRSDFGQNNVTGDLGEGTEGVTEALRHRILLPFLGDYRSFEHVLTHELVHEFQYDVYARGRAGNGLQALQQNDMPLWFAEGMAEYLSIGPNHRLTDAWLRDAGLNGKIPTIEQMTLRPDRFFPYRYGESLWQYIGQRWGDETIGQIMNAMPTLGVERAFKREIGLSLEELSDEWREAMQVKYLPPIASLDRPRRFAQPMLTERRSGGEIFLAPSLSSDGKYVAFLSNGNFYRGEVFIDLWLGDALTGKRIKRLVKSTTDPNFEELRFAYSQSAFSPDGKYLAFTAQRAGKDVMYLLDLRSRETTRRYDLPLKGVTGPSFSPDSKKIVFSGSLGGLTDLYTVDVDGTNFRQLTNDKYGDLQPQWSPDGRYIAFATDRGEETNFEFLKFHKLHIALLDMQTGEITNLPGQAGLNLNPQWSPDSRGVAFISDRTGIANVFLYDLDRKEHYQLTNVIGAVSGITEYSPAMTWARQADRLAFTYFADGDYTVWSVVNPRALRRTPFRDSVVVAPLIAARTADSARTASSIAGATSDTTPHQSLYRGAGGGFRPSSELPKGQGPARPVTVAALLDSVALSLPDTTTFKDEPYHVRFSPDYVARPTIGYVGSTGYGSGLFGGTTIILSDMLGNNRLAFAGEVNGRLSEARLFAGYTNLGGRLQYSTGVNQAPYYTAGGLDPRRYPVTLPSGRPGLLDNEFVSVYTIRSAFGTGIYPLNRFSRFELGLSATTVDQTTYWFSRVLDPSLQFVLYGFQQDSISHGGSINFFSPSLAYVSDNSLATYTGPIYGRRYRFQIEPTLGTYQWIDYLADYRRYDPIIFSYLTFATRLYTHIKTGRDEGAIPSYIGRPEFVRGYDRDNFTVYNCAGLGASPDACNATKLLGSRVALANVELRFPVIRRLDLGLIPIALPPVDGLVFFDAGLAWYSGQRVLASRPEIGDNNATRYPLRSYGFGLRANLFNFAIIRWDYAKPLDSPGQRPFWVWSIGPSF